MATIKVFTPDGIFKINPLDTFNQDEINANLLAEHNANQDSDAFEVEESPQTVGVTASIEQPDISYLDRD